MPRTSANCKPGRRRPSPATWIGRHRPELYRHCREKPVPLTGARSASNDHLFSSPERPPQSRQSNAPSKSLDQARSNGARVRGILELKISCQLLTAWTSLALETVGAGDTVRLAMRNLGTTYQEAGAMARVICEVISGLRESERTVAIRDVFTRKHYLRVEEGSSRWSRDGTTCRSGL